MRISKIRKCDSHGDDRSKTFPSEESAQVASKQSDRDADNQRDDQHEFKQAITTIRRNMKAALD